MSGVKLRRARDSDYDFAERLYVESMKRLLTKLGMWNEQEVIARFKMYYQLDEVQIIAVDGKDVGWLQISETDHDINLDQIHLEKGYRARGIGSRLIQDVMTDARAANKPVLLSVVRNNPALALYRRLGFKVVGSDEQKLHMRWDRP